MIDSLLELNDVLSKVVQRMVEQATQNTTDGNWISDWADVSNLISEQDYLLYFDLIAGELLTRQEVLDVDTSDHQLNVSYIPAYCPNYSWSQGDEEIFGCDREQWERTFHAKPLTQPLSITRLSEIGKQAIAHILESSDTAIEDLTESVGMSMAELKQLNIYDPEPSAVSEPITFEVFDVQNKKTHPCTSIKEALKIYQALGNIPFKYLAAVVPIEQNYSNRMILIHQEGEMDVFLNNETSALHLNALRRRFPDSAIDEILEEAEGYVRTHTPIVFTVLDPTVDPSDQARFTRFEDALEHYRSIDSDEKSISFLVYDELGRGHGAVLMTADSLHGQRVCSLSKDAIASNPHIALAFAKATLSLYPNDEKAWALRDQAEKQLGFTDRVVDTSKDLFAGKWRIHVVPNGGRYGSHNHLVNEGAPIVQFFDCSANKQAFGTDGQLASSYYVDTILGRDGWSKGEYPVGLSLDADVPQWTVSAEEMKKVISYLESMYQEKKPDREIGLLRRIDEAQTRKTPVSDQKKSVDLPER